MTKPKRPAWLKFNLDDWCNDHQLMGCPLETQGFFVKLMRWMRDADPPGYLVVDGAEPDAQTLAMTIPHVARTISKHIDTLKAHKVLRQGDDGIWYSKRMVEDRLAYDRQQAYGKMGGNPALTGETDSTFEKWWSGYPNKQGRP